MKLKRNPAHVSADKYIISTEKNYLKILIKFFIVGENSIIRCHWLLSCNIMQNLKNILR